MMNEPWKTEPDYLKWIDQATGYPCVIRRDPIGGSLCGYVRVPRSHPFYRCHNWRKVNVRVHGGITFSGRPIRMTGGRLRGHWFGFDCGHCLDRRPGLEALLQQLCPGFPAPALNWIYRDWTYVQGQVESLARQLKRQA